MKKLFFTLFILLAFPIMVLAAKPTLISGIDVEGIGQLTLNRTTWNLTLYSTLDYTKITVAPLGDNVTIEGDGKLDIKEGKNTYVITAKDGSETETYTININMIRPSDEDGDNPPTGAFISYISIILLLTVGFILFAVKGRLKKI